MGCISGGAPLDVAVGEFFERIGIKVYQGYGLSETSPVESVNTDKIRDLASVGTPLKSYEAKTDKDTGDIVSFDGTMTSAKLDSSDQVIIPTNMFRLSHLFRGRQGTAWQEYNGIVDIILENKYNIMYSGAYRSYIYVHVFVEDETP